MDWIDALRPWQWELEWAGAAFGVACVALVAVRSMWNFPAAIVSVGLLCVVFWIDRLYSDALLQLFFIAINLYGWVVWSASRAERGEVLVERLSPRIGIAWAALTIIAAIGWGWGMQRWTDASYPYWDAAVAAGSVAAQILQARRQLESWVGWIAVDLLAIPLYAAKGLWPVAGLYVIYLGLAIWGLVGWHRAWRRAGPVPA